MIGVQKICFFFHDNLTTILVREILFEDRNCSAVIFNSLIEYISRNAAKVFDVRKPV